MRSTNYQPTTGQQCSCKRGIQRDNCSRCEGTGWVIDFAAIRERKTTSQLSDIEQEQKPSFINDTATDLQKY